MKHRLTDDQCREIAEAAMTEYLADWKCARDFPEPRERMEAEVAYRLAVQERIAILGRIATEWDDAR